MNLKTYRAETMAGALSEVKKDLGKDAVILHTRVYKSGAVMGLGGKQVVEITASDQAAARAARPGRQPPAPPAPPAPAAFVPASFAEASAPVVHTRPVSPESIRRPAALTTPVDVSPATREAVEALQQELAAIRRMVGQVLECTRRPAPAPPSPAATLVVESGGLQSNLFGLLHRLMQAGVSEGLARQIVESTSRALGGGVSEQAVRAEALRQIASLVSVVRTELPPRGEQAGPRVIALVGPTGVGKTTTIAKLAATFKLRHGRRVGLVTCDTYRIAAVEQLRVYANIIGVPLRVALTPEDMTASVGALGQCDVILADTAGRSHNDRARLDELAGFVDAAGAHERHLVLSAGVSEPVLARAAEQFARLRPDRVILSKLDEAVQFGPILNVLQAVRLPVSQFTTGQEVPDHLEPASAARLAALVLDGPGSLTQEGRGG